MIDCHAHLASAAFAPDFDAVVERAVGVGVERILIVGEDAEDDRRVLALCARRPELLVPCVGLHPDRFAEDRTPPSAADLDEVEALARGHRAILGAVGEVGLDYYWVKTEERRALQRAGLERLAALALALDLALNVHSRSAGHHAIDLLAGVGARRVLMHAFDGKASYAKRAWEAHGYVFSIPPSVVRSEQKQKLVRALPLEALALETDSPVLGPVPKTRNEPANLPLVVEAIARLKDVSAERVLELTRENAERLFSRTAPA